MDLGSVWFTIGLDDLKGLSQPKWFCDSFRTHTSEILGMEDAQR